MAQQGGYRQPSNPAPVSGPGSMSKRTDRGQPIRDPGGLPYGDNQDLRTTQGAAPMAAAGAQTGPARPSVPLAAMGPDLYAPTDRPGEPLTAGSDFGPGPGSAALGPKRMPDGPTKQRLTAMLPILMAAAEQSYASDELRSVVNMMRSING
jgi:hypothetical protein